MISIVWAVASSGSGEAGTRQARRKNSLDRIGGLCTESAAIEVRTPELYMNARSHSTYKRFMGLQVWYSTGVLRYPIRFLFELHIRFTWKKARR